MTRRLVAFSLILLAVLSRLLPHPPNVAPITALALFGGVYLEMRYAFLIPLAAMLVSDALIGFYPGFGWIYGSFLAIGLIGLWLKAHPGVINTAAAALTGSVLFFIVTNFGVWVSSPLYPHTPAGLGECYTAALPFFRNTLIGDAVYVGALFGAFELMKKSIPALAENR
jgi:hypothetical protein